MTGVAEPESNLATKLMEPQKNQIFESGFNPINRYCRECRMCENAARLNDDSRESQSAQTVSDYDHSTVMDQKVDCS